MVIYKAKNYQDMSRKAANIISAQIIMKPDCVLGLATGSSPVGTYKQLIEWYNKGDLDFSKVTSINLDEYKGLSPENDQSYRYFMNYNLFNHVNIDKSRTFVPDGLESDSQKACDTYNEIIRQQGGIDLQISLGTAAGIVQAVIDDRGDVGPVAAVGLLFNHGGDGHDLMDGAAAVCHLLTHVLGKLLIKAHQHLIDDIQRILGRGELIGVGVEIALQTVVVAQLQILKEGEGVVVVGGGFLKLSLIHI